MGHYRPNVRDIEFNLFEVLGREKVLGTGPYAELDAETARDVLGEVSRLAVNDLAASFAEGDRNPPTFDASSGSVTVPEGFRRSYQAYIDGDWDRLELPAELGGFGAPPSLRWAAAELILGANPAVFMYAAGAGFAGILHRLGNADQRRLAELMVERHWGATMVLTEPDAGSDVGAGRTKAVAQPDGTWHLEGVKRFITSADWDWPENIVHLVLARPEGHGPGTKGLSLFVVPKFLVDVSTGELGEHNGVYVTNVEHKMGLKVSATCEVTFGADRPAVGYLVGDTHDGIRQMFEVIETARMMVGTKAMATLSTGYLNALEFARERLQGADLTAMADKSAPRVPIIAHPDVRRMLMLQKSYAEGLRALVLYAASTQDEVELAARRGERDEDAERLNDLLLPLVKGVGSERSYEMLALSLQTLGGSGYLQDYPIEQYIRDAKIDTLYEGTTGIQGMDLFFRKVVKDGGAALRRLVGEMRAFVDSEAGNGRLKEERACLTQALDDVEAMVGTLVGWLTAAMESPQQAYLVGQNTTRLLMSLGDAVLGWLLLRQADVALTQLTAEPAGRDAKFYEGKVATARFFARQRLPLLSAERAALEGTDLELMEIPAEAF